MCSEQDTKYLSESCIKPFTDICPGMEKGTYPEYHHIVSPDVKDAIT